MYNLIELYLAIYQLDLFKLLHISFIKQYITDIKC